MSVAQVGMVLFCVSLISLGQVLFKYVGLLSAQSANGLSVRTLLFGGIALSIYGFATLIWIYLLRSVPLSKAYPFMALSFVLVPFAAYLFYGETVTPAYYLGLLFIMSGIVVIARFG